jgi:hypothetical protein
MNRGNKTGPRVHDELGLTPATVLAGAHAPRRLRPRELITAASKWKGAKVILTEGKRWRRRDGWRPAMMNQGRWWNEHVGETIQARMV